VECPPEFVFGLNVENQEQQNVSTGRGTVFFWGE
jgi:hypothetical protein